MVIGFIVHLTGCCQYLTFFKLAQFLNMFAMKQNHKESITNNETLLFQPVNPSQGGWHFWSRTPLHVDPEQVTCTFINTIAIKGCGEVLLVEWCLNDLSQAPMFANKTCLSFKSPDTVMVLVASLKKIYYM